jgi:hypothetical protein
MSHVGLVENVTLGVLFKEDSDGKTFEDEPERIAAQDGVGRGGGPAVGAGRGLGGTGIELSSDASDLEAL